MEASRIEPSDTAPQAESKKIDYSDTNGAGVLLGCQHERRAMPVSERYDRQDGAPQTRPDSGETVNDKTEGGQAIIGERSTKDDVAGQGLGQMKDEDIEHRAPGAKD
jgi:hypothetical protein